MPEHEGRGYERQFSGDVYGGEAGREGRDWRPVQEEREGFWGRGHQGSGYQRDERRDYSREDYGASNRGGGERGARVAAHGGSFSRTGEEGRGGQGYGWQRGDFGQEASGRSYAGNEGRGFGYGSDDARPMAAAAMAAATAAARATASAAASAASSSAPRTRFRPGSATAMRSGAASRITGAAGRRATSGPTTAVQEDVNDRLADDPYVDASEIEVTVSSGEVTLSGSVDSRQARRRAEDIAEQVSGVSYVQNNLRVRIGGGETTATGSAGRRRGLGQESADTTGTAGQNKRV